jgi:transcription elongation factor GreA
VTPTAPAQALLRGLDLLVDGPVRWGASVPERRPGIYVVELSSPVDQAPIEPGALLEWLARAPTLRLDGEPADQGDLHRRLASFWLPSTPTLYVGQAPRSIAGRVAAQLQTPIGARRPFGSALWLRALRPEGWRVWWARTDAVEEYADALLSAFAEALAAEAAERLPPESPVLPFGNLSTVDGRTRPHGITGGLVDEEATAGDARRSGSAAPGRAAATRRSPAAARTTANRPTRKQVAASLRPASAAAPVRLSADGLARMRAELDELVSTRRPEVIARVASARSLGDLKENAEYQSAREEQSFLEGRIQTLEATLRHAVEIVVTGGAQISLGSNVVVQDESGEQQRFTLVGTSESDVGAGRISDRSPVGRALLGRAEGDEVVVPLPAGQRRYRVIEVS